MQCNPVLMNKWMQAIENCTYIVIIIVVLYCPLFVPSSLYDPKYGPKVFVHSLEEPYSFTLKKKTSQTTRWQYLRERLFKQTGVPYAKFKDMTKFKKELRKMKEDQIYRVKVSKLYFRVHADEIVDANESPIGLFEWLYYLFVKCGIRKKKSISLCCNANMFGNCLQSQKSLSKLEQGEGNEKNIKIANETKNTNAPEAETPHQLKNGEIIIKGVFKKKLNDKIVKDVKHVKGWNIADIDVTY
ncbi:unnamed protein product [Mytilus edulis]|uniref:Uncharacterized protein n=1 Tax=Mytilus edulis TaxID=6550 RepID=A0A8S3PY20_MYTED|nr:unnamed protein product [Mytilus edulis]